MNKTTFYQTLNRPDIKSTRSCTFLCTNDRAYTFFDDICTVDCYSFMSGYVHVSI